ncbi:MAG: amidohydrolase family protein, partial [Lysobacterales bacterium]
MNRDPQLWKSQLRMIDQAQQEGLDIRGQVISRPIGVLMGHPATMSPFRYRPTFRELVELPTQQRLEKLRDPVIKARILAEDNVNPHIFVKLLSKRFDLMFPLEDPIEYLPAKDSCVTEQARQAGQDPEEWLYDYFLGNDGNNLIYIPGTSSSEEVISTLLAQGIHMLTRQPAQLFSLNDRGLIAEGMKADINIIDFDSLKLHSPHIVNDLPTGGKRFLQNAEGIDATLVSGQLIYSHGEATGALPGKLIRGMRAAPG